MKGEKVIHFFVDFFLTGKGDFSSLLVRLGMVKLRYIVVVIIIIIIIMVIFLFSVLSPLFPKTARAITRQGLFPDLYPPFSSILRELSTERTRRRGSDNQQPSNPFQSVQNHPTPWFVSITPFSPQSLQTFPSQQPEKPTARPITPPIRSPHEKRYLSPTWSRYI